MKEVTTDLLQCRAPADASKVPLHLELVLASGRTIARSLELDPTALKVAGVVPVGLRQS